MNIDVAKEMLADLPGSEFIIQGVQDLENGVESIPAYLVATGAPRLQERFPDWLGKIQDWPERPELRLYALLLIQHPNDTYSQYNAYLRRLSSFCSAAEHRFAP